MGSEARVNSLRQGGMKRRMGSGVKGFGGRSSHKGWAKPLALPA